MLSGSRLLRFRGLVLLTMTYLVCRRDGYEFSIWLFEITAVYNVFFFCFIVSSALRCPLMTVLFMFGVKILVVAYFFLIRFHSFLHVQESTLF